MHTHHHHQPRPPWFRDWSRPSAPAPDLRVSDAERAEVTGALYRHYGDGRLDDNEYNERSARASAAKTQADLAQLLIDLPRLDGPAPPRPPRRPWRYTWLLVVVVILAWSASAAATFRHPHVPWALVVIGVLIFLGRHRRSHHHQPV